MARPLPPLVAALAAVCAVSCADAVPESLGRAPEPIINGTPDPGETGTVYVSHLDYPFLCSGTVIGPTLVVTAKHCTFIEKSGANNDTPMKGNRFRVGFGPQQGQLTWRGTTKMEWIGMPGNVEVQPAVDGGEDVALLWLSSAVPSGTKIHAVKLDYVPKSGDQLTIVGYGRSSLSNNKSGVKLMTVDAFNGVNGATGIIQAKGKGACSGDSGGSFYFGSTRELVGVTSTAGASAPNKACDIGITNASSVRNPDVNAFLANALGQVGVCAPTPEICGDGKDQDCDNVADNQCQKDGQPCATDVDCENGSCQEVAGQKICTKPCDDKAPCPANSRCVTSCTQGFCLPGTQGTKKLSEACADSSECASNHCAASGCSLVCNPLLGQCPDDMACAVTPSCGECAPLASVPGPRKLGEACSSGADCETDAQCVDDGFGNLRCATACLEGNVCSSGFACRNGLCLRTGGMATGERCLAPEDCGSFLCALFPEPWLNYCTRNCTSSADCGNGFDCKHELGAQICVPAVNRMGEACVADSQCTSDQCHPTLGICTRQCNPQTAPCPPGFLCHVVDGEMTCVPGPGAFPTPADAGPPSDAGAAGTAAGGGVAGAGASAGTAGTGAGGAAADSAGSGSGSGCGCRTADRRDGGAGLLLAAAALGLARLGRRRGKLRA